MLTVPSSIKNLADFKRNSTDLNASQLSKMFQTLFLNLMGYGWTGGHSALFSLISLVCSLFYGVSCPIFMFFSGQAWFYIL
jgi:hypothetical protein